MNQNDLITEERIQQSIRAQFNPIPSLTPRLLSSYLDSFRLGFFRNAAIAWDAIERRDYKLQTVAAKRKKAVARNGWEIITLDESPLAQEQKRALEYFYNHLTATNVLEENETGGMSLLIRQMMDAMGKRYAVHEIVWEVDARGKMENGGEFLRKAEEIGERGTSNAEHPTSNIEGGEELPKGGTPNGAHGVTRPTLTAAFRFCPLWWFEGTQGRLRFLPTEFAIYGVDLEPGGWLVTAGDGLMEASSIAWLYKNLPMRDWLAYTEKFGMPGVIGKTEATLNSDEWNKFAEIVKGFASDWSAICDKNNSIELIQPKGNGDGPFAALVEKMDRAITALWRGGDLGTLSSHNATGASLQADEADILEADDAQMIGETLTAQVSRRVLEYYFGDAPQLAYLKIRTSNKKDVEQSLKVDQFLLEAGAPMAVKDALERYGRAMPAEGEELLKVPKDPNTQIPNVKQETSNIEH